MYKKIGSKYVEEARAAATRKIGILRDKDGNDAMNIFRTTKETNPKM